MSKTILFLDMDCVIADFNNSPLFQCPTEITYNPSRMYESNFFETLPVIEGAQWAVHHLMKSDLFDVQILSKPVSSSIHSYSGKAAWILKNFPNLANKINLTQEKELLAAPNRILIDDDRKWKKNWEANGGTFIGFNYSTNNLENNRKEWEKIVSKLIEDEERKNLLLELEGVGRLMNE